MYFAPAAGAVVMPVTICRICAVERPAAMERPVLLLSASTMVVAMRLVEPFSMTETLAIPVSKDEAVVAVLPVPVVVVPSIVRAAEIRRVTAFSESGIPEAASRRLMEVRTRPAW